MKKTTMPLVDKRRIVAFCSIHNSQTLTVIVKPKLVQKLRVLHVAPCIACLLDQHKALEALRDKVSEVFTKDIRIARLAVKSNLKKEKP